MTIKISECSIAIKAAVSTNSSLRHKCQVRDFYIARVENTALGSSREDRAKKKEDKASARDTYQTECIVARKRRKIETPLSRPAPPRSVLVADMFQQRFPRVDIMTALYRAFAVAAATAFLMIFFQDLIWTLHDQ